ncbi:MAG: ACT domain-containing protein [Ruminococcaceae bacterium]|nr:ACT domain-containing protein [Oscillospiraceae bacterium]
MTIKQLSIFAENRNGALYTVTETLAQAGIDIRAFSVADTQDFGVLRLIVSDTEKAKNALAAADMIVSITDVIAVEIPDTPGGLSSILKVIYDNNVAVEYMYAFVIPHTNSKAYVVLRVPDNNAAAAVLNDAGITLIDDETVRSF